MSEKKPRYKTYTVQKYSLQHGYLGHCCFTSYERAVETMQRLVNIEGWTRARVLGGCKMVFLQELSKEVTHE